MAMLRTKASAVLVFAALLVALFATSAVTMVVTEEVTSSSSTPSHVVLPRAVRMLRATPSGPNPVHNDVPTSVGTVESIQGGSHATNP